MSIQLCKSWSLLQHLWRPHLRVDALRRTSQLLQQALQILAATRASHRQRIWIMEKFEIFNLDMKIGDTLKVKGKISDDTDGFSINLGCSSSDLALHFNPRFNESVIVCNSKCKKAWQEEHRDDHLCFSRGSTVKIVIEMKAEKFQVKLPDDHKVEFPNRHCYDKVSYMSVKGGFRVTSFKLD